MNKILIVGGVAGDATAAARLRRLDENAEIIMFERGGHISFANCGTPYYIGGVIQDREDLLLHSPESFKARFNITTRVFSEFTALDPAQKNVTVKNLKTGEIYTESYDKLILAPGAAPIRPSIPGVNLPGVFTLRNMEDADNIKEFIHKKRPKTAVIVGGGFIGLEMAENLKRAGLEVSIAEMADQVLAPLDFEMACALHRRLENNNVKLYLNNGIESIAQNGESLTVNLKNGELITDALILAAGVRAESDLAAAAGLKIGDLGGIVVDEHMQTSDENIYAAGDVTQIFDFISNRPASVPLAGPANRQGRVAADNICGIRSVYDGAQGSAILKIFGVTVAATGANEKTLKKLGRDYDKIYLWLPGHAGYYPGTSSMSMKIIFENKTGKILGAQLLGADGVDKRADVLAAAIRAGTTAGDLARLELCYAPPFSSAKDPVNIAGYAIENVLNGLVKNFHYSDVQALPRDGSAILLDVRSPGEVRFGKIPGFINIPLDDLRARLGELDKSKPVYVHCHSGLRSYIAARILTQKGFDAYNLSGGYLLYATVYGNNI
jgi:NADPH-dependent 2,4-dienoyl-CoA reductase/sulfur reductase-like enzyme/rhodanese-related sulfurtransferase